MFSLTVREQSLIAAVLVAVAAGAVIHHFRKSDMVASSSPASEISRGKAR